MAEAYCRFMAAYARGQYEDAAIWCRRIAECFCIVVLRDGYVVQEVGLLGEMLYQLPEHLLNARVWDDLCGTAASIAVSMGCFLSTQSIRDDLGWLQWYGNQGAHAHPYFDGNPVKARPEVVTAVLRIVLLFVSYNRASRFDSRL